MLAVALKIKLLNSNLNPILELKIKDFETERTGKQTPYLTIVAASIEEMKIRTFILKRSGKNEVLNKFLNFSFIAVLL